MGISQRIGALGEELVVRFLVKRGYEIVDRNFRRPWGEIDIIARKRDRIHFVEVKAVSAGGMSRESDMDSFRPEDNVHPQKIKRLSRIIQTYLSGSRVSSETLWQFDVATVQIDMDKKKARVNFIEDIIL